MLSIIVCTAVNADNQISMRSLLRLYCVLNFFENKTIRLTSKCQIFIYNKLNSFK